jgi:hypothetical protein
MEQRAEAATSKRAKIVKAYISIILLPVNEEVTSAI